MSPEAVITKSNIIVVDQVDHNTYGDLTFTDKEGNSYKIAVKRIKFFESIITSGAAVKLNYAEAYGKEYIYSAVKVELPPPTTPGEPLPEHKEVIAKAVKEGIKGKPEKPNYTPPADLRQESIEHQTAVKTILDLYGKDKLEHDDPLVLGSLLWLNKIMGEYCSLSWQTELIDLVSKLDQPTRDRMFATLREKTKGK